MYKNFELDTKKTFFEDDFINLVKNFKFWGINNDIGRNNLCQHFQICQFWGYPAVWGNLVTPNRSDSPNDQIKLSRL